MDKDERQVAAIRILILVPELILASAKPTWLDLFQHELVRTSECPACGELSVVNETNNDLQVRFEDDATLAHTLQNTTFGDSLVTGRRCTPCGKIADIMQTVRLETSPDVLVLQLVRFKSDGTKNMARISFSEHLNLTRFTSDGETFTDYRLASVVHHRGATSGGHYICVAKNPAGLWNRINDNEVERDVGIGAALDPEDDSTPYLLFYVRNTPRMVRELE